MDAEDLSQFAMDKKKEEKKDKLMNSTKVATTGLGGGFGLKEEAKVELKEPQIREEKKNDGGKKAAGEINWAEWEEEEVFFQI